MARVPEPGNSVYDFLYVDQQRLAQFESQFSRYGNLTSLTRSVSELSSSGRVLNIHVAKVDTTTSGQTSQTRAFDPQWLAPLSFLDEAEGRGMIVRDLAAARIGQLALVSGVLTLFDLSLIQKLWNIGSFKAAILRAVAEAAPGDAAPDEQRRHRPPRGPERRSGAPSPEDAAFDMLKHLPHAVLATIAQGQDTIWTTLKDGCLAVSAADLLLKHGARISGRWNMIGILDAMPDEEADMAATEAEILAPFSLGALGAMVSGLAPAVRAVLGRPGHAFGMTPLLIFREVATHA